MKKLLLISFMLLIFTGTFAATVTISVGNGGTVFSPSTKTVSQGDDIVFDFSNATFSHTVTSETGAWTQLTGTGTVHTSGLTAGTYNYYCIYHSSGTPRTGMVGSFTVVAATGVIDSESKGLFTAFPNPVENRLTLSFPSNSTERADMVKIVSAEGNEVASYNVSSFGSDIVLDLSTLKEGFYFCRIYSNGAILDTRKIVKKK